MQVLFPGNDLTLRVNGVRDEVTSDYLNAATVTAVVKKTNGEEVAGQTWPLTLDYVAASNGNYIGNLEAGNTIVKGRTYKVEVTAQYGGFAGFWSEDVPARERGFGE